MFFVHSGHTLQILRVPLHSFSSMAIYEIDNRAMLGGCWGNPFLDGGGP